MYVTHSYGTYDGDTWDYQGATDLGEERYDHELYFLDRDGAPAVACHFEDGSWSVWWDNEVSGPLESSTLTVVNIDGEVRTQQVRDSHPRAAHDFIRLRARDGSIIQAWFGEYKSEFCDGGVWLVWN